MSILYDDSYLWLVIVGCVLAFILALGVGANDVANTFGTSVGARVLTMKQAFILASVFETAGAVLLGAKVSDTVRKGIIDITPYENNTELFMMGNLAALSGSFSWLFLATLLNMPVSATHSIVGATVGFALVVNGKHGVDWFGLGKIIASWFISPVLAGITSLLLYTLCNYTILKQSDPVEPALLWLPVFYGFTLFLNTFSIFFNGPELIRFDRIPMWGTFALSFAVAGIVAVIVRLVIIPWQRRRVLDEVTTLYNDGGRDKRFDFEADLDTKNKEKKDKNDKKTDGELNNSDTHCTAVAAYTIPSRISQVNLVENEETCEDFPSDIANDAECNGVDNIAYNHMPSNGFNKITNKNVQCNGFNIAVNDASYIKGAINGSDEGITTKEQPSNVVPEKFEARKDVKDRPETARVFAFLQILTASFGAFAHGGNDVANAIGPMISIWLVATSGQVTSKAASPMWILAYGGLGISIGLWIWGRRVIKTMGEDLSRVTPSSGFCIELGAATTVLLASNMGIPISSTHCKVGSVVFIGRAKAKGNVDWSLLKNIIISWIVTLPATIGVSAAVMAVLKYALV